jgi:ERCC4-related helicase
MEQQTQWATYVATPLRAYQIRMCESSKHKNTIVVLPTGSGKTMIATALSLWNRRERGRKTLFFVPTQMLVAQQASAVCANAPTLRVVQYHGELVWPSIEYDVLVTTPEGFRLKMASGAKNANFENFGFIVFDEVHHVMKKHPYRKIARLLELSSNPKPTVLGLTATCTYAVSELQIGSDISKLCEALGIKQILSASSDELVRDGYHGATPNVQMSTSSSASSSSTTTSFIPDGDVDIYDVFDTPPPSSGKPKFMPHQSREAFFHSISTRTADPLLLQLFDYTQQIERLVAAANPSFVSPLFATGKQGKVTEWSTYAVKFSGPLAQILGHLYEALRLMVVTLSTSLDLSFEYLRMSILQEHFVALGPLSIKLKQILQDVGDVGPAGATTSHMCRFARLVDVMRKQLANHGHAKFRGILFVQQKITSHILKHFLDRTVDLSAHLRTECIYATSSEVTPWLRVTASQSKARVALFANGNVNLLIATAVAEEGMDVPAANCIIRFDPILTPVSFVQGRGRARQEASSFVVMDERPDRTVAHLSAAERAQQNLLARRDVIDKSQLEAAQQKRSQAQSSRELSARAYLRSAGGVDVAIVKTFCTKSEREVVEVFKKKQDDWCATVSVHGMDGEKWQVEATEKSKQEAKHSAYTEILAQLKRDLS